MHGPLCPKQSISFSSHALQPLSYSFVSLVPHPSLSFIATNFPLDSRLCFPFLLRCRFRTCVLVPSGPVLSLRPSLFPALITFVPNATPSNLAPRARHLPSVPGLRFPYALPFILTPTPTPAPAPTLSPTPTPPPSLYCFRVFTNTSTSLLHPRLISFLPLSDLGPPLLTEELTLVCSVTRTTRDDVPNSHDSD